MRETRVLAPGRLRKVVGTWALLLAVACGPGESSDPALLSLQWETDSAAVARGCRVDVRRARRALDQALAREGSAVERLVAGEHALARLREAAASPTVTAIAEGGDGGPGPDEATRSQARRCAERIRRASDSLATTPALLRTALEALGAAEDPLHRTLAEHYLRQGRERGRELDPGARTRLRRALERLRALESAYRRAMTADRSSIHITEAEAAELSPALLSAYEPVDRGYRVPVDFSSASRRFLEEMPSGDARRRYWMAFMRRGGPANVERLAEALDLRREVAGLLGYGSWAEYRMEGRLAEDPDAVAARLHAMADRLLPAARIELADLARLKRESGDPEPFSAWDYDHFRTISGGSGGGAGEARPYFPLDHAIPATLEIFGTVLGVTFQEHADTRVWAEGVRHYLIRESSDGRLLAELYLDLAPRPSKGLRPAVGTLRVGRRLPDGTLRHPVVTIVGNGPPGTDAAPPSFGHADLVEFFHELGHAMHMALSAAPYASLQAVSVSRDFVEAPSQMFEGWAWSPHVLRRVSRHPDTGRPLADSVLQVLVDGKGANTALFWTRQAAMALWDLRVHGPSPPEDPNEAWFRVWAETTPIPIAEGTLPTASFLPAMGGYDAGYYGYVWSKLYARDLFTAFQGSREALLGPEVGMRFRRRVLEPGATESPDALVRAFLGREVRPDAFYRELGLSPEPMR